MALTYRYKAPILMLLAAALLLRYSASAQVTFSRDWTAGKRSLNSILAPDCATNIKSTIALCQMLVNELRQLASCELRNHLMLNGQSGPEESALDSSAPYASNTRSGR